MAGLIKREVVDQVRERARIDEVVAEHVTLRTGGIGSLKGLCPFHDEKSPSFHVRPTMGRWHCFGCGEGGDVISFVQKIDGMGFTDAVEYLATRFGVQVEYEDGGSGRSGIDTGTRSRLLDANRVAGQYYAEQLGSAQASAGREFLRERSFDREAAQTYGVGFAPTGWDSLLRHLRGRGFTEAELLASGLVTQGQRGVYDRFRGRLIWPIRDVTGEVIGFGARKIFDDDQGPKYLNTPETALYKKSQVLYGIDLARRAIAKDQRVVVVEGYTDVMAAHLSGVGSAVATCGTAFGSEHARVVRRMLGDTSSGGGVQLASGRSLGGEVIFTFDGDAAGQKAALRAFGEDEKFLAQTFVAISPGGMDPCELRMARGPRAVQELVDSRKPLFEFVLETVVSNFDVNTAEGRVGAVRSAASVIARIRDAALRPEYERRLAGLTGLPLAEVRSIISREAKGRRNADIGEGRGRQAGSPGSRAAGRDPLVQLEYDVLSAVLQFPQYVPAASFDSLGPDTFSVPTARAVHDAIRAVGGVGACDLEHPARWLENLLESAPEALHSTMSEMAASPLPQDRADAIENYVRGLVIKVLDVVLVRRIADQRARLARLQGQESSDEFNQAMADLMALEMHRRQLREAAN
ncbi:DNA primase [Rarobacter faecitabidus]|uniref:DNA primase n=1 Tax=Rarobacter faecitabidus TaxID=13243 RepID=A0A542ZVI6_RARFA|nr:DNA primase [Rarobacter faecitabidus]TQL64190.1 DNA primase [Rarobacter faecitabidus]